MHCGVICGSFGGPQPLCGGVLGHNDTNILIAILGQSNAQERALASGLSPANSFLTTPYANVTMIAQQDNSTHDPSQWQNFGPQSLGPINYDGGAGANSSVGFCLTLLRDLDTALPAKKFYLATIAVLDASLVGNWNPSGNYPASTSPPNLYQQAVTYIKNAMTSFGCTAVIVVWEQGEADAKTTVNGTAYQANLTTFISSLRASLGNVGPGGGEVPFVFGKMNADASAGTYLGLSQLRASQVAVAGAVTHTALVSQDSITQASGMFDGTHYNGNGYAVIGHLMSPSVASFAGVRVQPVASFTKATAALQVTGTDTSVSYGDTIVAWRWDWGDGNFSTTQNPVHVYAAGGTYNITLTVTNSAGDQNTSPAQPVTVANVTKDATKGWYKPATTAEWTGAFAAMGLSKNPPRSIRKCNDTTNNGMADVGSANLTLTPSSSPAPDYQQTVSGWADKGVGSVSAAAKRFSSTDAGLPDINTTSQAIFGYFRAPSSAPAAAGAVLALGTDASTRASVIIVASTGKLRATSTGSNTADTAGSVCDSRDIPFLFVVDRTHNTVTLYTDTDKLTPTFGSTMTGKGIQILAESAVTSAIITFEYEADWSGTDAEFSTSDAKTMLQWMTGETITAY